MAEFVENGGLSAALNQALNRLGVSRPLVVVDEHVAKLTPVADWLRPYATFSDFTPNPEESQVQAGMTAFAMQDCDSLVAIGGGSAIDVAKSIKAFQGLTKTPYVKQALVKNALPLIAVPTTAGTGSEATPFAVVYQAGRKYSVAAPWLRPHTALLAPELLAGLPPYQRASGMLDALSQAIESFWSMQATPNAAAHSKVAIALILANADAYMQGDVQATEAMMQAAHAAGLAIGITTTTAAHALSYALTHRYHIAHGHAVAMCLPAVWSQLLSQPADWRAADLPTRLDELDALFGGDGVQGYRAFVARLPLTNVQADPKEAGALAQLVNAQRLANHPAKLSEAAIADLYIEILSH